MLGPNETRIRMWKGCPQDNNKSQVQYTFSASQTLKLALRQETIPKQQQEVGREDDAAPI